jgi:hypothetical protein
LLTKQSLLVRWFDATPFLKRVNMSLSFGDGLMLLKQNQLLLKNTVQVIFVKKELGLTVFVGTPLSEEMDGMVLVDPHPLLLPLIQFLPLQEVEAPLELVPSLHLL